MKKFYYLSTVILALLLVGTNVRTTAQTLVQPTSTGIVWVIGNTYNITWTGSPATLYDLHINYNGISGSDIVEGVSGNTYAWNTTGFSVSEFCKIDVTIAGDDNVIFSSLNNFELTNTLPAGDGEIHVEQPNVAGIQWEPGTQHGIYWVDDLVEPVKLELYTSNDGLNFTEYIAEETGLPTSVEGTGYIWTIGVDIDHASNYYIKVVSTITDDFDYGDNPFAITDQFSGGTEVNMLQPDVEGLQWESGTTHLISWMDDLIENVNLELYVEDLPTNPDDYIVYVPGGGEPASALPTNNVGTTVDWDIPATLPNGNYKVYATSSVTPSIDNFSEFPFEITDTPSGGTTITLIQPDVVGLQWLSEGTYLISWMDDLIENVNIELWDAAGTSKVDDIETNVAGTTTDWTIPEAGSGAGQLPLGNYRIKVISTVSSINDISENTFQITDTPSGGTEIVVIQPSIEGIEWELNTDHLISWMDDLIEPVRIKLVNYSTGSAVDVGPAISGIDDVDRIGTTWTWEIPETGLVGAGLGPFKIVITSSASVITDDSEYTFDIIDYSPYGEVIMIQPNGGEEWIKDNSYLISWTDNISENVDIYVANDLTTGPTWHCLTTEGTGVPSSTWTWNTATNWPFGTTVTGADFGVKIRSVNDNSSAIGISEAPFSFVNTIGGEVWVIQPNGGEVWVDETEYLLSWMDELVENVYVKLLKGGDHPVNNLVPWALTGLPANAYTGVGIEGTTLTWDIPETDIGGLLSGTDYKIIIESIYDPSYFDISEGTFTIATEQTGGTTIEVIQPNGGEEWALNTTHLISWNDDVYENVNIDLYSNSSPPGLIASIATDVEGTTYEWDIASPAYGVGTYLVRVYSPNDGTLQDFSDSFFTITGTRSFEDGFDFNNPNSELVMYPNPASTQFTVAASSIIERIEVRNLLGQTIFSNEINAVQTNIDISRFDTGLYIVNVIIEGNVVTKKLFVQ